ncbi:alpha-ketoglutarate-dependent dioxygenase AlkB [Pedobacter yulinensis]|uniref:Alpha-ketoglutarate-dependent dioxygenase AlkB n=2 Tax=Pedobacter yulinensis TaxID=2126353 RepID=A0A2T3HMB5_9SPHI|nr:alpha-ketoglutarate-dependent dioxygenase AlkB [Pedobacter yulinensis]
MGQQLSFFCDSGQSSALPDELLEYRPGFLTGPVADDLFTLLHETAPWQQRLVRMYEKDVQTPRLTAWFGDEEALEVVEKTIRPLARWTPELEALRRQLAVLAGVAFNSVLLNLYRDGQDSVAWHSDKETIMGSHPVIASVSLGQVRTFDIRRKADHADKYAVRLEHGSLLLMKGKLQQDWEHRVAKSTQQMGPRINLTFRKVVKPRHN